MSALFSAPIETTTSTIPATADDTTDSRRAYVLAELRTAALRSRLQTAELDMVGTALRGGLLGPEDAIAWLDELGHADAIGETTDYCKTCGAQRCTHPSFCSACRQADVHRRRSPR